MTHYHNCLIPRITSRGRIHPTPFGGDECSTIRATCETAGTVLLVVGLLLLAAPAAGHDIVRADFQTQTYPGDPGVFEDGLHTFSCLPDASVPFDYVDNEDTPPSCIPDPSVLPDNLNSDSSGGGRWHLHVTGTTLRRLHIDFSAPASNLNCNALNALLAGLGKDCGCPGSTSPASTTCDLRVWISADRLFKKNATRQTLGRFHIFEQPGSGPNFFIDYVNPLFICPDDLHPNDPNWKVLQSTSCPGVLPTEDVSLADVIEVATGGVGENINLGQWYLPIKILAQRVPLPGGGGGSCTLKQKGELCSSNSECCSGKCSGKPGEKTCK